MTTTTRTLLGLADALDTATLPEKPLVYDSELYFLTAKVMMKIGHYEPAVELLNEALRFSHPVWKVRMLGQLMECHRKLGEDRSEVPEHMHALLNESGGMEGLYASVMKEIRVSDVDSVPPDWIAMAAGLGWVRDLVDVTNELEVEQCCRLDN